MKLIRCSFGTLSYNNAQITFSVFQSDSQSLSVRLSVCQSVVLSICLSVRQSVRQSVSLSVTDEEWRTHFSSKWIKQLITRPKEESFRVVTRGFGRPRSL